MSKNIVLIGFMATGKTEVGKALSKKLGLKYISTDDLIERKAKSKIKTIFIKKGEPYFRDLETKALKGLLKTKGALVSCGGGIVIRPENRRLLKKIGTVVLLKARPETVDRRLKDLKQRPLLNIRNKNERLKKISAMLSERSTFYKKAADITVNTDLLTIKGVVNKITECNII